MDVSVCVPYAYPLNGNGCLVGESPNLVRGDNNDYNCKVNFGVEVDMLFDSYLEALITRGTLMMRQACK